MVVHYYVSSFYDNDRQNGIDDFPHKVVKIGAMLFLLYENPVSAKDVSNTTDTNIVWFCFIYVF